MTARVTIDPVSLDSVLKELQSKLVGIKSITTPYNTEQISKAVFTLSAKEFLLRVNTAAAGSDSLKHMYEWNNAGNKYKRLFRIVRASVRGGNLVISTKFLPSRTPVPISPQLSVPGRSGKRVTSKHIFKNKAEVMENGTPVRITAKAAQALAIPTENGPIFIRRPRSVYVKNPGGESAKNGYSKFFMGWFGNPSNLRSVVDKSGMISKMERSIARELQRRGSQTARISTIIKNVSTSYSQGVISV
jgi:hypothetical protein